MPSADIFPINWTGPTLVQSHLAFHNGYTFFIAFVDDEGRSEYHGRPYVVRVFRRNTNDPAIIVPLLHLNPYNASEVRSNVRFALKVHDYDSFDAGSIASDVAALLFD